MFVYDSGDCCSIDIIEDIGRLRIFDDSILSTQYDVQEKLGAQLPMLRVSSLEFDSVLAVH